MAAGSAFPAYNEHPAAPADSTCNRKGEQIEDVAVTHDADKEEFIRTQQHKLEIGRAHV